MSEERKLYEGIYILDVNTPEDQVAELVALFENVITEAGGEVVGTRDFATRRLAFEIDGHSAGIYKLLYFYGEVPAIDAFKHETAVRPGVIRARCYIANPEAIVKGESDEEDEAAAKAAAEAAEEETPDEAAGEDTADEAQADETPAVEAEEAQAEETPAVEAEEAQ